MKKMILKQYVKRFNRFYMEKTAAMSMIFLTAPFLTLKSFAQSTGFSDISGSLGQSDGKELNNINWPWTNFLKSLAEQLTGPLPMVLGILGIAAAAIGMFMGNHGAGMQKMLVLIFAVSICLFAPSFINFLQQGVGGATIFGM